MRITRIHRPTVVVALALAISLPAPAQGLRRAVQRPQALAVAAGTPVEIRLLNEINTGEAKDGDTCSATLMNPLALAAPLGDGRARLEKNTTVTGRVVKAVSSGRLKRPAELVLELTGAGGQALRTEQVTLDGKSHGKRNAALIGGGAAAGAIIGALAGGGKGAAIGAATGAGAGTAGAYLTGKNELVLPVETPLRFVALGGARPEHPMPSSPAPGSSGGGTVHTRTDTGQRDSTVSLPPAQTQSHWREPVYTVSGAERATINNYVRGNDSSLPPGLAKRGRLPPGLERQVQRNGTLPPGLQRRLQPFPVALTQQLAPLPSGISRVFLGNRVLVVDQAYRVLDLFMLD